MNAHTTVTDSEFVYCIRDDADEVVKLGYSKDPTRRVKQLQTGSPRPLRFICAIPGGRDLEASLHQQLASQRISGEWFADSKGYLSDILTDLALRDVNAICGITNDLLIHVHCMPVASFFVPDADGRNRDKLSGESGRMVSIDDLVLNPDDLRSARLFLCAKSDELRQQVNHLDALSYAIDLRNLQSRGDAA